MFKKIHVIERSIDALDNLRKILNTEMSEANFSPDIMAHFELCIYEIVINIIEHSILPEGLNPDTVLKLFEKDGTLTAELVYYAEKFDYTTQKLPDISLHFESGQDHGLGVYIIRTLMEDFSYSFSSFRNTITMSKKIR